MRISDWSSDVCSSDLGQVRLFLETQVGVSSSATCSFPDSMPAIPLNRLTFQWLALVYSPRRFDRRYGNAASPGTPYCVSQRDTGEPDTRQRCLFGEAIAEPRNRSR